MFHRIESQKIDFNKVVFSNYLTDSNHVEEIESTYTTIAVKNIFSISEIGKNYAKTDKIIVKNAFSKEMQQRLIKNELRYKFSNDKGLVYEYYSFAINNTLQFIYFEKDLAEREYNKIMELLTKKTANSL